MDLSRLAKFSVNSLVNPEMMANKHLAEAAKIQKELDAGKTVGYDISQWTGPHVSEAVTGCRKEFVAITASNRERHKIEETSSGLLKATISSNNYTITDTTMDLNGCAQARLKEIIVAREADARNTGKITAAGAAAATGSLVGIVLGTLVGYSFSHMAAHAHRRRENRRNNPQARSEVDAARTPEQAPNGPSQNL